MPWLAHGSDGVVKPGAARHLSPDDSSIDTGIMIPSPHQLWFLEVVFNQL
jgi:hypothetical protein